MITMEPVGVVHSPYKTTDELHSADDSRTTPVTIEVFEEYAEGLRDVSAGDKLTILFYFHQSKEAKLIVLLKGVGPLAGVFSSRSPNRPNFIGSTDVEVLAREGRVMEVIGADMIDGTPVLDIKPTIIAR